MPLTSRLENMVEMELLKLLNGTLCNKTFRINKHSLPMTLRALTLRICRALLIVEQQLHRMLQTLLEQVEQRRLWSNGERLWTLLLTLKERWLHSKNMLVVELILNNL